ncbi:MULTISPECIES: hypothetical protein [unclassified Streptomyces]|uniref:hypothetical protein n=1 Tax=unclassified Streptomyces TaxID=2593676 RepID=UPI00131C8D1A|nr:hypothetical protein [Streptomyces sp. CB01201]
MKEVSYQSRRNREVELCPKPGLPTLVEFQARNAWNSAFFVGGIARSAGREDREPASISTWGRKPYRFLLEPRFTHVFVTRLSGSKSGGGIARWRLRAIPASAARILSSVEVGLATDVVRCTTAARSVSYELSPKAATQDINILHIPENGKKVTELIDRAMIRGTFKIPGPGYLQIETPGPWEIRL